MKRAAWISFAVILTSSSATTAAPEQCRFVEPRAEREACYQRQQTARDARQKALETQQQANQPKPYEPMASEDVELAKAIRGICRGC